MHYYVFNITVNRYSKTNVYEILISGLFWYLWAADYCSRLKCEAGSGKKGTKRGCQMGDNTASGDKTESNSYLWVFTKWEMLIFLSLRTLSSSFWNHREKEWKLKHSLRIYCNFLGQKWIKTELSKNTGTRAKRLESRNTFEVKPENLCD